MRRRTTLVVGRRCCGGARPRRLVVGGLAESRSATTSPATSGALADQALAGTAGGVGASRHRCGCSPATPACSRSSASRLSCAGGRARRRRRPAGAHGLGERRARQARARARSRWPGTEPHRRGAPRLFRLSQRTHRARANRRGGWAARRRDRRGRPSCRSDSDDIRRDAPRGLARARRSPGRRAPPARDDRGQRPAPRGERRPGRPRVGRRTGRQPDASDETVELAKRARAGQPSSSATTPLRGRWREPGAVPRQSPSRGARCGSGPRTASSGSTSAMRRAARGTRPRCAVPIGARSRWIAPSRCVGARRARRASRRPLTTGVRHRM